MQPHKFTIANETIRARIIEWVKKVPLGYRIEFKEPVRTLDQNAKLWAMLQDIALQRVHHGRKYTKENWKVFFMELLGQEIETMPSEDGDRNIELGYSSSKLSKPDFSDLITLIIATGDRWGIKFTEVYYE